jgi:DNA-binding transcriptional regulator YiaG
MSIKLTRLVENCVKLLGSTKALSAYIGTTERTVFRWLSSESKPSAESVLIMYELLTKRGHTL